jgi:hypothetical protein
METVMSLLWVHAIDYGPHDMDDPEIVQMQVPPHTRFDLKQVPVSEIPHFTRAEWEEDGHDLSDLTDAYRNDRYVPPVTLDHERGVIDGGHRSSAADDAGRETIPAFVQHRPAQGGQ